MSIMLNSKEFCSKESKEGGYSDRLREDQHRRTFNGIFQSVLWQNHGYGINCKLSGSVCATSDIQGAIPIIHGPSGCSFHQRLTPLKFCSPVFNLPSTNLNEDDAIYGGEGKLRKEINEVCNNYHPSLIVVLPTCLSSLIGDDIPGIINDLKPEISAEIVYVASEGFSHRCKESLDGLMQLYAGSWQDTSKPPEYELAGCGHQDLVVSLVDQLMEEQDIIEKSINIETHMPFERRSEREIEELKRLFSEMRVRVNMTILTGTVEDIKCAPAAELNVVTGNIQAAKRMNEKFGTDYLRTWFTSFGISGIEKLMMNVATKFGLEGEAEEAVKKEKRQVYEALGKYRDVFRSHNFAASMQGLFMTPYLPRIYSQDLGLPLKYLFIDTHILRTMGVSEETIGLMIKNMEGLFDEWGLDFEVIVDPTSGDMSKIAKGVDCLLSERFVPYQYGQGKEMKVIDVSAISHLLSQSGFSGVTEFAKCLADRLNHGNTTNNSIISKLRYNKKYYPALQNLNSPASRDIWWTMWSSGSAGGD